MNQMRFGIATMILWFAVLFNVERLHEPINIASFVYVLSAVVALIIVAVPHLKRAAVGWLIAGSVLLVLTLKHLLGYQIIGDSLPLTVTESLSVAVTVILTRRVTNCLDAFEDGVLELARLQWSSRAASFRAVEGHIYREVRRARQFGRPLSLVSLRPESDGQSVPVHPLIEDVQRRNAERYLDARILEVFDGELHDCDLVAKKDSHFVLMLAEADRDRATMVVDRLARLLKEQLGLVVRSGIAVFPDEEVTLAGLLARAEDAVNRSADRPAGKVKREATSTSRVPAASE